MKSTLHRQLEDIFGFGGGMADELANQIVMCHRDQVSLTHIAESVQDPPFAWSSSSPLPHCLPGHRDGWECKRFKWYGHVVLPN